MKTMEKTRVEQPKTIIYVAPDGSHIVKPKEEPTTSDMVIKSYDNELIIESTVDGCISTEPQRTKVSTLVGDWLGKRRRMMSSAKGEFRIREIIVDSDGYPTPMLIIKAPSGRPSDTQLNRVARHAIEWLNATGCAKAEDPKDPEPKPEEPKPEPKPEPKAEPKAEDPKDPEPKPEEPKPEPKPEPKAEPKAEDPKDPEPKPEEPKPEPKPEEPKPEPSPKWDGILWDPNKSIDENLDLIMGKED